MDYRFTIIVVHRNGVELISRCLRAVLSIVSPEDHVVVVDNGSSDQSIERIKSDFHSVELIENNCNKGFAAANNQVLSRGNSHYYLLLNNDVIVDAQLLEQIISTFDEYPRAAVVSPQLCGMNGDIQRSSKDFMRPVDEVLPGFFRRKKAMQADSKVVQVDSVVGACMAVQAGSINEAGVLDEDFFFYFEETEWCNRFYKCGYTVLLDKKIRVIHEKGYSTRSVRREAQIEMLNSRLIYYRKVFNPVVATLLTGYRVFRILINFIFATILVLFTLGMVKRLRQNCMRYGSQLVWLAIGRPSSWGLPDKCPLSSD